MAEDYAVRRLAALVAWRWGPRPDRLRWGRHRGSRPRSERGADCGDLRIAINPWTGYVSNAHVIGQVAKRTSSAAT